LPKPITTVPLALLTQLVRQWKAQRGQLEARQVCRESGPAFRRDANARAAQLTECIRGVEDVLHAVDRNQRTPALQGAIHG
jgi:hypothetical protein